MASPKSSPKSGASSPTSPSRRSPKKSPNGRKQAGKQAAVAAATEFVPEGDDKNAPAAWIQSVLLLHNERRAAHWTPPLVWSQECYEHARMQAQACETADRRLTKNFVESLSGRHGQNSLGPSRKELKWDQAAAEHVVTQWYSELEHYDFHHPGPQKGCVNFIQMMWAGTCSVGMALSSNGRYCVANYFPPVGNVLAYKYAKNLHPPCDLPPPWITQGEQDLPEIYKKVPCAESNWKRHEEVTALLDEGAKYKPLDTLNVDLPDLDPF
ncbi:Glipr2 [Symbiodinium sp. CCMP2456]|nr:Glipr2 [Symbiodinium sp. CCMP2456]